jgi:hypothetical protein
MAILLASARRKGGKLTMHFSRVLVSFAGDKCNHALPVKKKQKHTHMLEDDVFF